MYVISAMIPLVTLTSIHPSSFFSNVTSTTQIYTLSLHDALPISVSTVRRTRCTPSSFDPLSRKHALSSTADRSLDRKSTRLNSSHEWISYAVFCLKKKKNRKKNKCLHIHSWKSTA